MSNKKSQLKQFLWIFVCLGLLAAVSFAWAIKAQATVTFDDVFNPDDVKLVNASESGLSRGYTPICDKVDDGLSKCHLTLHFLNPKIGILLKSTDLTYVFKTLKGNPVVRTSGYDVLDGTNWVELESVDVVAGESLYVDLWAEIEGEDWQIDAIPEILGFELSQFALWESQESGDAWLGAHPLYPDEENGQVFVINDTECNYQTSCTITKIELKLGMKTSATLNGTANFSFWAMDNTSIPNGTLLGNFDDVVLSEWVFNTTAEGGNFVNFTGSFTAEPNVSYAFSFAKEDSGDNGVVQYWAADGTGTYPDGDWVGLMRSYDPNWRTSAVRDMMFWIYSEEAASANESSGREAIEQGIANALSGQSYTIYTDQQVYLRHMDNTQQNGTFDKFLLYGNQRWGFNYVTTGEEFTNMTSIGTTVNVWENQTLTSDDITYQVESSINSTKV